MTGAYFWGLLGVYNMLDHAYLLLKHDLAYDKHLIDLGSKRQWRNIWSALR